MNYFKHLFIASIIEFYYTFNYSKLDIKKNEYFKNLHYGKRCFIVGNGPSSDTQDLSVLKNEYVFTVNQSVRNKHFKSFENVYHMWVDKNFFDLDLSKESDLQLLEIMKLTNCQNQNISIFYPCHAKEFIVNNGLDINNNVFYFKHLFYNPFYNLIKFDFSKIVSSFYTVSQYQIILAIFMGFKEIYITGCENTVIIDQMQSRSVGIIEKTNYGYSVTENERKRMLDKSKNLTAQQELYSAIKVLDGYESISKLCEKMGVKLFNLTDGGILESIERKSFKELFN